MKKGILAMLTALFMIASFTAPALADLTFHQGPSFTDLVGDSYDVNLFADVSGLGGTDLVGTIEWSAIVQYTCQNKGGKIAPGQPLPITDQANQTITPQEKNGRAVLDLTDTLSIPATIPGDTAVDGDTVCPNGNWIGINPEVQGPVSATGTITWGEETLFQETISPVSSS